MFGLAADVLVPEVHVSHVHCVKKLHSINSNSKSFQSVILVAQVSNILYKLLLPLIIHYKFTVTL